MSIGAGTFYGMVSLPAPCASSSPTGSEAVGQAGRVVIKGAAQSGGGATVIDPNGDIAAFAFGGAGGTRANGITFSTMNVVGGTFAGFLCYNVATYPTVGIDYGNCRSIRWVDITGDDIGDIQRTTSARGVYPAFIVGGFQEFCSSPPYDNNVVNRVTVTGNHSTCWSTATQNHGNNNYSNFCGANTNAFHMLGCGSVIANSSVKDIRGQFTRVNWFSVYEGNTIDHVGGDADDGSLQGYRSKLSIFRRNVVKNSNGGGDGASFAKVRATENSFVNAGGVFYNNTIDGNATACADPANVSATEDCYISTAARRGMWSAIDGIGGGVPYSEFRSYRNIYRDYGTAVRIDAGGTPSICPSTLIMNGDIFYNNTTNITNSCPGNVETPTVVDPGLDAGWDPNNVSSPACHPPGSEPYQAAVGRFCTTASDCPVSGDTCSNNFCSTRDTLSPWVGALQGACPSCGDNVLSGDEECDVVDSVATFRGGSANCDVWPSCMGSAGTLTCMASCQASVLGCVNCGSTPFICRNGVKDVANGETDVDCGGGTCQRCYAGAACTQPSDCASSVCTDSVCVGTGGRPPGKQQDTGGNN